VAEYGSEPTIGARIKAARRSRGIKSIREFADLLQDVSLTESVLENIEAGRKTDLPVSSVLNIARALRVPPPFLLSALTAPTEAPDLPNLSPSLRDLSLAEFDAWLIGDAAGAYRPIDASERNDLAELDAFRELERTKRELQREQITSDLGAAKASRMEFLERRSSELTEFLRSAGWQI
jgi:transcriptional regulator with XRE-family HTH domain